jgi:head-tail adaptor
MTLDPGALRIMVTLENPGDPVPDGYGGFTQTWTPCTPPRAWASIKGAKRGSRERVAHLTVVGVAVWDITLRFHSQIINQTRLTWRDRAGNTQVASVRDVDDVEYAGVQLNLIAVGSVE